MSFRFRELVGRYELVVSNELLAFIERAFVEPARPDERQRVRNQALDEARHAELEITPDGTIISRSGEQEFYRVKLAADDRELEALCFEKLPPSPVTLVLVAPDRLLAHQPHMATAEFRRLAADRDER